MIQFSRLLLASLIFSVAKSQHVKFDGTDVQFNAWLNKVYAKTHIDPALMEDVTTRATKVITQITDIMKEMDDCIFNYVQLRGSAAEGLKILFPDEFDFVLFNYQLKCKIGFKEDPATPDFAYAIQNEVSCMDKYKAQDPPNAIDPSLVRDRVFLLVKQALKQVGIESTVEKVGPSINFRIPSNETSFPEIDIDLVLYIQQQHWPASARTLDPSLQELGVGLVAKVLEAPQNTKLWQISFSAIEIKLFKTIDDKDHGCRKKLLKIAKYLKEKMQMPKTVSSYNFKTLLMDMNDKHKYPANWTEAQLVNRFRELMDTFLADLQSKTMYSFFVPTFNLFKGRDLTEATKKTLELFDKIFKDPNSLLQDSGVGALRTVGWPDGQYCLPMPSNQQCPFGWEKGIREHDTEDFQGSMYCNKKRQGQVPFNKNLCRNLGWGFCCKTQTNFPPIAKTWPIGSYCIFRYGGSCPEGFNAGSVYWDDEDVRNANKRSGNLPDGNYNRNTKVQTCCRNDGPSSSNILDSFPQCSEMVLMRYKGTCPSTQLGYSGPLTGFLQWDTEDISNADKRVGAFPDGAKTFGSGIKIEFCSYTSNSQC